MKQLAIALFTCASLFGVACKSSAALVYAIDESNGQTLISFDWATPQTLLSGAAISGLQPNETIKGIDFRPSSNQLFALGSTSRLYTLNLSTGAATQVGAGPFAIPLDGSNFGFDFNPVIDRIRVVSNTGRNYVVNPNDGTAVAATDLAYGVGDFHFGKGPNVSFSAYTNNVNPAPATTQLYGIDTALDNLVTQANSAGTLATVGSINLNAGAVGGFDIAGNVHAYAVLLPSDSSVSRLYRINLALGLAQPIGQIDGGVVVSSMSILWDGSIPEPASLALFAVAAVGMAGCRFRR